MTKAAGQRKEFTGKSKMNEVRVVVVGNNALEIFTKTLAFT